MAAAELIHRTPDARIVPVTSLRNERATVVNDIRHIVDLVLLRVARGIIAAVVLAPVVAHVYARVWPRH